MNATLLFIAINVIVYMLDPKMAPIVLGFTGVAWLAYVMSMIFFGALGVVIYGFGKFKKRKKRENFNNNFMRQNIDDNDDSQ
jgi:heme/copper-type cytochrome/quinol oxidase subunit 2